MQTASLETVQAWRRLPAPHVGVEQVEQLRAPSKEKVEPAEQGMQLAAPLEAYVPARHSVQVTLALGPLPLFE